MASQMIKPLAGGLTYRKTTGNNEGEARIRLIEV